MRSASECAKCNAATNWASVSTQSSCSKTTNNRDVTREQSERRFFNVSRHLADEVNRRRGESGTTGVDGAEDTCENTRLY